MLTLEQKALRQKYLCASDASAALGLNPYKSPVELWLEKRGELIEDATIDAKMPVRLGNAMESAILEAAAERLDLDIRTSNPMSVHPNGIIAANFDALAKFGSTEIPLEAKYAERPEEWGPATDGIDGVPQQYAVQMLTQIAVANAPHGYLAAYVSGRNRELRTYQIVPPAGIIEALERKLTKWWADHVIGGARPEQDEPCSIEVLARRHRLPGKTVEVDPGLISAWRDMDAAAKDFAKQAENAKAKVLEALGDAEVGTCPLGTITYREQSRKEYTVAASTFRVCRFVATKGGVA